MTRKTCKIAKLGSLKYILSNASEEELDLVLEFINDDYGRYKSKTQSIEQGILSQLDINIEQKVKHFPDDFKEINLIETPEEMIFSPHIP